jgi:hypothetical protein
METMYKCKELGKIVAHSELQRNYRDLVTNMPKENWGTFDQFVEQYYIELEPTDFKERVYEIAFGDDAIKKGYTDEEVIEKLQEFSDLALEGEEKE